MFHFGSKSVRKPSQSAATPAAVPPEVVEAAVEKRSAGKVSTREVVELLEADLKRAGKRMDATGRETKTKVAEAVTIVEDLKRGTDELADQTGQALANINTLAEGMQELHHTAEDIGRRAHTSQQLVDEAVAVAKIASRSVDELRGAIEQIQAVVALIADVAGQTNLLALNATIEAARAGPAGRGFAVVANEVKALSVETQKATTEIGATIGRLRSTAQANIEAVDKIIGLVGEIGPVFGEVSQAVQMQIGTTAEINKSALETARFTEAVASRAQVMSEGMARAAELGRDVATQTDVMNGSVSEMTRQLVTVLRQTPEADRRRHDRWPTERRGTLVTGSNRVPFHTIDLSLGGTLLVPEREATIPNGSRLEIEFSGLTTIVGTVVGRSHLGLHVKFAEDDAAAMRAIAGEIATLEADFRPMIDRALRGARAVTEAIEAAIERRELSASALFDTSYRPIAGTSPVQYETQALSALEAILPPTQEAILGEDERIAFAACVDINGWLPVHNRIYSQPQRPGETLWNIANSRNRRIYDDRTGLISARNTRPFLVQSYMRDLGGGKIVAMKEVDVPLIVDGRHWGGFRTAYRM